MAATLTDSQVRKGKLHRKGDKKQSDKSTQEKPKKDKAGSSKRSRKRKASQNFAVTAQPAPAAQPNQVPQNQPAPPPAKKPYAGNAPLCNRCNGHHQVQVPCRQCATCGRLGHLANICRFNTNQAAPNQVQPQANPARPHFPPGSCYNCGEMGHYKNNCPRLANANPARGRAFNMNANEARADNEVVNGTFLVNNHPASVLFDSGADRSFVSLTFEPLLSMPRTKLGKPLSVEIANGEPLVLDSVIHDCQLNLNNHLFPIDLTPMQLGSFDVIIGMDWLRSTMPKLFVLTRLFVYPFRDLGFPWRETR